MESLQRRLESWFREQGSRMRLQMQWRPQFSWPPWKDDREQRKRIQEDYERRMKQIQGLCRAVKADSVPDLHDILCSMVLSECVYKRPASEMVRFINKFKADFGGQVVSLERVQPSLDHVTHRYLLAEAGDTLFASFIGTKQYKDVVTDVNIFQGAIFHDDSLEENEVAQHEETSGENEREKTIGKPFPAKSDRVKNKPKPAAHRGFLGRAKGIPALELYRLAQKKKRKLVLCGHSLGGAVAVLATLAILRVIASSSTKENDEVQVKCITFSQPPVGNAALRDYVHRKGWQHYFKTYCIPEDLVPRILSPAYFHHYNAQPTQTPATVGSTGSLLLKRGNWTSQFRVKSKENNGEQLVLGLGPVRNSLWRLSRLVPLGIVWKQLDKIRERSNKLVGSSSFDDSVATSTLEVGAGPPSLEIQENSDGISLTPLPEAEEGLCDATKTSHMPGKRNNKIEGSRQWRRVPSLPSYVPFGQLFLLGNSSVDSLSNSEYSKLTSMRSVIVELRELFQSHSMKSYRSRFHKIFELCMGLNASPFLGMDQLSQFPNIQQWLGIEVPGNVELGNIVEPPSIRTATAVVPLGWTGTPVEKNVEPLKVDITGYRLHLCTLIQAQLNGIWYSTAVETLPSMPSYSLNNGVQSDLQKMRILIGAPLKQPPMHHVVLDSLMPDFPSPDSDSICPQECSAKSFGKEECIQTDGLHDFFIFCTSDFITASKAVYIRTRRVKFIGLEGAGKTSLYNAIVSQSRNTAGTCIEDVYPGVDAKERTAGGLCYIDSAGVNIQDLHSEVSSFRDELWMGARDFSKKIDLIVLVHNLSQKIPLYQKQNTSNGLPALSLILNEAKLLGVPWVLAITNKFSIGASRQKDAVDSVVQAYQASPSMTKVINSCPLVTHSIGNDLQSWDSSEGSDHIRVKMAAQNLLLAPINLVRMPFNQKSSALPVEGVNALCQLIHHVLRTHEEASRQELVEDRLLLELNRDRARKAESSRDSRNKANSLSAAAVGASVGAGLGLVLAVVMGAASALRKP